MCQIIVKQAGKKFNMSKLNVAQGWNEDGYGVTWWESDKLHTFKTMNFNRFKAILSTLNEHKAVAHLRNTTRGTTCENNNHPFDIPSGKLFHNGTIAGVVCSTKGGSDTQALSELIEECDYRYVEDILPMVNHIVGNTLNKLVFFEDDGNITYVNKHLGLEEDGIWYSNDYHKKTKTRAETLKSSYGSSVTYELNEDTGKYERVTPLIKTTPVTVSKPTTKRDKGTTRIFVYGTLKKGFGNHYLFLGDAEFVGKATTVTKWAMVGKGMSFPYILKRDNIDGSNIVGEVYEVDSFTLHALDVLEGVDNGHYKHSVAYVSYANGLPSENVCIYVKGTITGEDLKRPFITEFTKSISRLPTAAY